MIKTNYIGHDERYKERKAKGRPGWDTAELIEDTIATLEEMLQAEYVPKKGRVLELGCGAGNITLWLAERGYDVYGVDIAPTAIEWAEEKAKERGISVDFRVGNVLDLQDYPDDFFDFVLDGHCFHCIIGEDREMFLASASRVLKPGGIFLIASMCGEVMNEKAKRFFDPQSRCLIDDGIATRYIGLAEDILDEVKKAGFRILHREIKARKSQRDQEVLLAIVTRP